MMFLNWMLWISLTEWQQSLSVKVHLSGVGVGGHCIAVDPEWLKAASKRLDICQR